MDKIKTKDLARGRWRQILTALGVPAKVLNGKQQPCLFCGGKYRARFTNWKDDGFYLCNQCGSYAGTKFLAKYHGWTYARACQRIDGFLAGDAMASLDPATYRALAREDEYQIPKATKDCALWLQKHRPAEELEDFLKRHHPEVRWWLADCEPATSLAPA